MTTFDQPSPRFAFALTSVALSLLTLGTFVVLPAHHDGVHAGASPAAMGVAHADSFPVEVSIMPARIEVTAVREPNVAWAMGDPSQPNCKPDV